MLLISACIQCSEAVFFNLNNILTATWQLFLALVTLYLDYLLFCVGTFLLFVAFICFKLKFILKVSTDYTTNIPIKYTFNQIKTESIKLNKICTMKYY